MEEGGGSNNKNSVSLPHPVGSSLWAHLLLPTLNHRITRASQAQERERQRQRQRQKQRQTQRQRMRQSETETERQRSTEKERNRETEAHRNIIKGHRERQKERHNLTLV